MTTQTTAPRDQLERLARLKNYATRYEIRGTNTETGQTVLIGYTAQKSRAGILAMCRKNGAEIVARLRGDSLEFGKRAADGATLGHWRIGFSGRTQREAIIAGELPFFLDAVPVPAQSH